MENLESKSTIPDMENSLENLDSGFALTSTLEFPAMFGRQSTSKRDSHVQPRVGDLAAGSGLTRRSLPEACVAKI